MILTRSGGGEISTEFGSYQQAEALRKVQAADTLRESLSDVQLAQ